MTQAPNRLSLLKALELRNAGRLSAEALAGACLGRIAEREPAVGAWEHLDGTAAIARARAVDRGAVTGPLAGIPVGVKDIFDAADMPTGYGSPIYAGHRPRSDAAAIALLRAAGAIMLGKTVTTEFAYFEPGRTRNPHNLDCTPGGSSMGSAAAVADFMVPVALGTQTAGSVIRPAAYCGIVGYKPSYGRFSLVGAKAFSPSLDTLGIFAREVGDLRPVASALLDPVGEPPPQAPRFAVCRTAHWDRAEAAAQRALGRAAEQLRAAGAEVIERAWPAAFGELYEAQQVIMAYEAARSFTHERTAFPQQLSPKLTELCERGLVIDPRRYRAAQAQAEHSRALLPGFFANVDAVISPSTTGEAPAGRATGDPVFNRAWTLLHVPVITVPAYTGPRGLPIGIQLASDRGEDARLLAAAAFAQAACGGAIP